MISFTILEQSRVILSQAGRARYTVICVNPAFTKMIDGTEKPKSQWSLQNAQHDTTNFAINKVILDISGIWEELMKGIRNNYMTRPRHFYRLNWSKKN